MLATGLVVLAAIVLIVVALVVTFVVGMRRKSAILFRVLRWAMRRFFNPRQMRTAGTAGAYAGIVRHRGRRTGTEYETPIVAAVTEDGFVVGLPYGTRPNWLKNVLAAGRAELVHEGATHRVDRPRVIPMADAPVEFTPADERGHRIFGVDLCLRVQRAGDADSA